MSAANTVLIAAGDERPRVRQLQAALKCPIAAGPADGSATTVWAAPWTRVTPLPVVGQAAHVLDLHDALAACPGWGTAMQRAWCGQVARQCRGASLLLVGSEAELGFWSALLSEAGVDAPLATVPFAAEARALQRRDGPDALQIAGSVLNPALRPRLDEAVAWARAAGLAVAPIPGADAAEQLAARARFPEPGAAALLLDLREDTPGERAATPPAVIEALAAGTPVASTVDGALSQAFAAAGGGWVAHGAFAAMPDLAAASAKAASFARARVGREAAAELLRTAIGRAQDRGRMAGAAWRRGGPRPPQPLGPRGRVLVLSEESPNLGSVRVQLPFGALHRRGAIGGYAVLRGGEIVFDTRPADPRDGGADGFDAVWVHRSMDPGHRLLLQLLGRPYAYDIDDNLLAAPRYRDAFYLSARETARDLLQGASVVSCATPRLAGLLSARADIRLADRLVITPNLGQESPPGREAGRPRAVIWASSDRPALTDARAAVVRAVRDHCLAHRTPLVCIGAPPPDELTQSGVEVEAIGMLPHAAYREHLRGLSPAILVCPLQTGADAETQDFIDGKSDIKAIEALSYGLVGVFSRAQPYLDSDLPGAILCDNTYDGWLAGLEAARGACLAPGPAPAWPEERDSEGFGLAPWAAALERARLPARLPAEELRAAVQAVAAQESQRLTEEAFDEAHYLANYEDIRLAVADGIVGSGFAHYEQAGRREGRYARKRRTPDSLGEAWWAGLLHEIGQMEAAAARRDERIGMLERRIALRRALAAP